MKGLINLCDQCANSHTHFCAECVARPNQVNHFKEYHDDLVLDKIVKEYSLKTETAKLLAQNIINFFRKNPEELIDIKSDYLRCHYGHGSFTEALKKSVRRT